VETELWSGYLGTARRKGRQQTNRTYRHRATSRLYRLAGESATEVHSIIQLVEALSGLSADEITDPALITAVQMTAELDQVLFPLNKKSTQKEPQRWSNELHVQGVSGQLLNSLRSAVVDGHTATMRAKKAVACLLFVSGKPMAEIEAILTQFSGAFGGAAGPVRGVAARSSDLLPVAARVAEILLPALDLGDRVGRLVVRLTYGVPGSVADLAREAGADLLRGDYCALAQRGLGDPSIIAKTDDGALLAAVGGDGSKVTIVRAAAERAGTRRAEAAKASAPVLEAYIA
jgi:helicase